MEERKKKNESRENSTKGRAAGHSIRTKDWDSGRGSVCINYVYSPRLDPSTNQTIPKNYKKASLVVHTISLIT